LRFDLICWGCFFIVLFVYAVTLGSHGAYVEGNSYRQVKLWKEKMINDPEFRAEEVKSIKHICLWTILTKRRCEYFWSKIPGGRND